MNLHALEPTLKEVLNVINPLREDWDTRMTLIHQLQDVVESVESLRGATVEPFGSFLSNLFTRWGDLDISIQLSNGSYISSAGKKRKQNLLGDLLRALRQKGGFRRLQFIPNARVPILKLESNHQNISCDISIDNLVGQMKSKFLFWINEIDGRFRDMVLLVKEWAKANNINNPKSGTFNSYSLSLLVIFHFQTCKPAILPPLKDIFPGNLVDDLQGLRANVEKRIGETVAANVASFKADKSRKNNRSSLSELFVAFLAKFADISLKASELGICTFNGQWEHIASNMRWLPNNHALFVEDPFEQPENCARAVSAKQLAKISEAFKTTHYRLATVNHSRNSLLAMLARPQISYFIAGTQLRYPGTNAGRLKTQTQVYRSVHSPSPIQHKFQSKGLENRPNNLTAQQQPVQQFRRQPVQRYQNQQVRQYQSQPVRQNQSQVQQMWRPKT